MGDSIWKVTDILVLYIVWSTLRQFCNELCMITNTILQILFQIISWLFNQLLKNIDET